MVVWSSERYLTMTWNVTDSVHSAIVVGYCGDILVPNPWDLNESSSSFSKRERTSSMVAITISETSTEPCEWFEDENSRGWRSVTAATEEPLRSGKVDSPGTKPLDPS